MLGAGVVLELLLLLLVALAEFVMVAVPALAILAGLWEDGVEL